MTPTEILRDFRTKYLGTYAWVKLPDSGKEVLCSIDAVAENRDRQAVVQLSSNEYGKLVINFASNHEMKFRFPNVGSFQHGKDSLVVRRRAPHRQYQRGLGAANHEVFTCTYHMTADMLPDPGVNLSTMESAFKAEKYRTRDALAILGKGKHRSVALDGSYSLSQPLDERSEYMLWCGLSMIGRVNDKLEFAPARGAEVFAEDAQRILMEV